MMNTRVRWLERVWLRLIEKLVIRIKFNVNQAVILKLNQYRFSIKNIFYSYYQCPQSKIDQLNQFYGSSSFKTNELHLLIFLKTHQMKKVSNAFSTKDHEYHQNKLQRKRRKALEKNVTTLQRYTAYMSERRQSFLKDKLKDYYGKNFIIEYQDRFKFEQQWQDQQGKKETLNYFIQENVLEIASAFIIILVFSITIWLSTIDLFFRTSTRSDIYTTLYSVAILILIGELLFKIKKEIAIKKVELNILFWIKKSYKQIFCIICYALKIGMSNQTKDVFWVIFELIAILFQYSRASHLYRSLRLMSYSLHYEYHSKICDLLITLFIILHSVAIVLYLSTLTGFEHTWLNSLNIDTSNEFVVYLYAFYFGSTTVLTVGYGDVSPKNVVQIIVTCVVQIVGIVTFAFIINEIGYSIGNLRKAQQMMEKDLSVIQKMRKHYKINDRLLASARSFVVNSKPNFEQLYPIEEKNLLLKFNEELRHNFTKQATVSVVKSSIFFLTRWSKSFCLSIAEKIQHIFISPNELLYQPQAKERIYIIKMGKVNIYAEKGGRKKGQNNLLKTIKMEDGVEVADNCYGTTAMISTRPVSLYAIAKHNTSAYYVQRSQFEECISQRMSDFEYYHELKSKIDGSDMWEEFEAPRIRSSKHHYNPTKRTVLCRYLATINSFKSSRGCNLSRSNRKQSRLVISDPEVVRKMRNSIISRLASKNKSKATFNYVSTTKDFAQQSFHEQDQSLKAVDMATNAKKILSISDLFNSLEVAGYFQSQFQVGKEFTNYFPLRNVTNVLSKIQMENFRSRSTKQRVVFTSDFYGRLLKKR